MTEPTRLTQQATQVLDQAYTQFKTDQLAQTKTDIFDQATKIFMVTTVVDATRQYLFEPAIATRVIDLGDQVIASMYQRATEADVLKLNFTGNDIRWLLGLPRVRRHHADQATN